MRSFNGSGLFLAWIMLMQMVMPGCSQKVSPDEMVVVKGRYGDFTSVANDEELIQAVTYALEGLGEEQFTTPDLEHATADLMHPDGWSILTHVDGFIRLDHHIEDGSEFGKTEYLYTQNIPPEELKEIYLQLGRGQIEEVLKRDWKKSTDELEEDDRIFYLYWNQPGVNDLHRAASSGNVEWARAALKAGADLNAKTDAGETPLHYAVLAEQLPVCQLLIESGAEVNARDRDGESVLSYATSEFSDDPESKAKIRALLIKHGAEK